MAIGRMLALALARGWLREGDREDARRWLTEMPDQVIQQNQKTSGVTVAQARAQALTWLDTAWDERRHWDEAVGRPSAPK